MMKRITVCAAAALLAGNVPAQLNLEEVAAEVAARPQPAILTFWQTHNAEETETLRAMELAFELAYPMVHIEMASEPFEGAHDKFVVAANGGEGPDILRAEIMWVAEFASLGLLREVTGYISEADRADFIPNTLSPVTWEGDLWGLPQVTDCLAFLYNREMYQSAGFEPPRTWAELVSQEEQWHISHPAVEQFAFAMSDSYFFLPFLWSFGGDMLNSETREPLIDSPEAVRALEFILSLKEEGVIPSDIDVANDYNNRMEQFKRGELGALLNGPWATADILSSDAFTEQNNLGIANVPHGGPGASETPASAEMRVSPVGGHALVISASCDEPEAAYLFIHWLTQPEQQARLAQANNLLPTRQSAYALSAIRNSRIVGRFGEVLQQTARNRPVLPESGNLFPPLNRGFQEAVRGAKPPAEALGDVATEWRELLSE